MDDISVIILAAGKGTRFGQKKQFYKIKDKELWKYVLEKAETVTSRNDIVVVGVDIPGGITRSQSVINGLRELESKGKDYHKVLILEAARPLVSLDQINLILEDKHQSCTYALPLTSTIIKKDGTYIDRDDCYKLSTPVSFDFDLFAKAYLSGKYFDYTDDTRIMYEEYGIKPFFLKGDENLLKITYKSDLSILELLLEKYDL